MATEFASRTRLRTWLSGLVLCGLAQMSLAPHFNAGNSTAFAEATKQESENVKSYYEQLHKYPELGKEESKTAEFIREKLRDFGYKDLQTVSTAPTTVIALMDTGQRGPVVCFRSELDARKCQEKSGVSFSSTIDGVMHNCGHDAHTAILLETAKRLMKEKASLRGKFVFLFQPAEECPGGADDIVADGVLKRLEVQAIFAQHCAPGVEAGKHTLHPGAALAGSNALKITLKGKGGHAAQPSDRDDLAGLSSLITLELERLPSRCIDPVQYPTVCSISNTHWNSEQNNVAPDTVTLAGTIRAFYGINDKVSRGRSLYELIKQLVDGLCSAYGVQSQIELSPGVPPTVNDPELCKRVSDVLAKEGIKISDADRGMFSEDFAYYSSHVPCAYFGLGISKDKLGNDNVHSSTFTINEECLEEGVNLFVAIAKRSSSILLN